MNTTQRLRVRLGWISIAAIGRAVLGVFLALAWPQSTQGATIVWANVGVDFATGSNWVLGSFPGGSDVASFDNSPLFQPSLAANRSVAGIVFASAAGDYMISGSGGAILTLGASGISHQAAGNQTFDVSLALALSAAASFTTTSTGTLAINSAVDNGGFLLTLTSSSTGAGTIGGVISGTGGLTKSGSNTWMLSGANTYTGTTTLSAGTLTAGNDSAFGTGTLSLNGGTLTADASRTLTNIVTLNANSTIGGTQALTFSGTLTNTGGNRTLTVSNTGGTTLANINLSNNPTNRALTLNNAGAVTVSGVIADGGGSTASGLIKAGTGTLTLTGANTYGGNTSLTAGTLIAGDDNAFGTGTLTLSGGTLSNGGTDRTLANNLLLSGSAAIGGAAGFTFNGALTQSASTTLSVSNSGLTTFSSIDLSNSITNRTLTLNTTGGAVTVTGVIANGGGSTGSALTKSGAGTLTLAGANTYGGITILSAGTLRITNADALGTSAAANAVALNAGTLQLAQNSSTNFSRNVTLGGSATVAIDRISGSGNVTHSLGNLVTGTNTLTVQGGANLDANADYGLTFGATTLAGTTLTLNVANNGSGTGTVTLGTLSNAAVRGLTKTGAGTLVLGAAAGTLSPNSAFVLNNGNLTLGADNALGASALVPITINNTAGATSTFSLAGYNQTITTLTFGGTGSTATSANNVATGTGTLTLGGTVTYTNTNQPQGSLISGLLNLGAATRTFTIGDSSNTNTELAVSADIAGTGVGLTKGGAGVLELSGNNSYDGPTTISAGTLRATTQASALGAGNLALTGGTLQLANNTGLVFGRNTTLSTASSTVTSTRLTGGAGVTHELGTLSLNSATMTLTANAGSNVTSGTAGITFGATTLANTAPTFSVGANTILSLGALNDTGTARAVTKSGAGTLLLAGAASTWTTASSLTVTNGTVQFGASDALGTSALTNVTLNNTAGTTTLLDLNGNNQSILNLTFGGTGGLASSINTVATGAGTLTLGGNVATSATGTPTNSWTLSGNVALAAGTRTFTIADSTGIAAANPELAVTATLSGTGNLTKAGSGTLALSGANTLYTGNTTVTAGTLIAAHDSALGTGTLILNSGTFQGDGSARTLANPVSATNSSTISGTSDLTFTGLFTQNNVSTTLTISNSGVTTFSAIDLTNAATNRTLTLNTSGGNVLVTGVIANGGTSTASALTKTGLSLLTLSGTNTYTGATIINAGTLRLGASGVIANASAVTVSGTGAGVTATFDLNGFSDTIGALSFGGSTTTSGAAVTTGAGTLTLGGTLTYTATNNPLGATISGNLDLGSATRTFTINDSTTAANDLTLSANISGTGVGIIKSGAGTLLLSGTNTQTGPTTLSAGTITVDSGATLAASTAALAVNAGILNLNNTAQTVGPLSGTGATATINLSSGHTLTVNQSTATTYSGILAGSGNLVKDGTGTWTLGGSSANTFTGTTTINAGTLALAKTGGATAIAGNLAIGGSSATLQLLAANQIADTSAVSLGASGTPTFNLNGFSETISSLASPNASAAVQLGSPVSATTLTVGDATHTTFGGVISGGANAGLVKSGSGSLILSGANTFVGNVTVSSGFLSVQHNSALGATSGSTTVASGAALQLSNAAHGNLSTSAEPLVLNGTGVAADGALRNIAGNNAFTGPITLNSAARINSDAGTLTLSGGVTSANFALTVGGAGDTTLSGSLSLGTGSLTKDGAGTLSLTATSATIATLNLGGGTLAVGGTTTLNTGALAATAGTLAIASGGLVVADYASGTTVFSGAMSGAGEFQKTGAGTLEFNQSFTASNLTLTLAGGTFSFNGGAHITVGTLHITGNTILDFNSSAGTFLSSAALLIDAGVTVTINNWISVADNAAASTAWYATSTVNGGSLGGSDQVGGSPLNQIGFTGYSSLTPTWVSGSHNGWFNHEIRPAPEPATYGAMLLAAASTLVFWRRRRARRG